MRQVTQMLGDPQAHIGAAGQHQRMRLRRQHIGQLVQRSRGSKPRPGTDAKRVLTGD